MKKVFIAGIILASILSLTACGNNYKKVNGSEIIVEQGYTLVYFEIRSGLYEESGYGNISNEEIEKYKTGESFSITIKPSFDQQEFRKGKQFIIDSSKISKFKINDIYDACDVENRVRN